MTAERKRQGPPQRQSCDRCHKQKLRCTVETSEKGGVCDRCFRRHARCVYSTSLPKGRPSLARQADGSAAKPAPARRKGPASADDDDSGPNSKDADESPDMATAADDAIEIDLTLASAQPDTNTAEPMSTAMRNVDPEEWPSWLSPLVWNHTPLPEVPDWYGLDLDPECLAAAAAFKAHVAEDAGLGSTDLLSPISLGIPPGPARNAPVGPAPAGGDGEGAGGAATATATASEPVFLGHLITQLSHLSMWLSSLRCTSTASPSAPTPSLAQGHTLQPIFAWLARGQPPAAPSDFGPSLALPSHDASQPRPRYPPAAAPALSPATGDHGVLHEVFSASYGLLEILHCLQGKRAGTPPLSTASTALSYDAGPYDGYFGLPPPPPPPPLASAEGFQPHGNRVVDHLVMACDTLLLEVYLAALVALQLDVERRAPQSRTIMDDTRLVLVVQLCSHLVKCQYQAVSLYLASRTQLTPSPEGRPAPVAANRESIALNKQVEDRLTTLKQMLRESRWPAFQDPV